jgi:hypothetical protein
MTARFGPRRMIPKRRIRPDTLDAGRRLPASRGRFVSYLVRNTPRQVPPDTRSRRILSAENHSSTALVGCS